VLIGISTTPHTHTHPPPARDGGGNGEMYRLSSLCCPPFLSPVPFLFPFAFPCVSLFLSLVPRSSSPLLSSPLLSPPLSPRCVCWFMILYGVVAGQGLCDVGHTAYPLDSVYTHRGMMWGHDNERRTLTTGQSRTSTTPSVQGQVGYAVRVAGLFT